jgi:predicted PhzF superfamily epimerase YddE/YHI9
MMKMKFYQVDAFALKVFEGNPAAVCLLDQWIDEAVMQQIAEENNLSETAFVVSVAGDFEIRWFTPVAEVDLCGHATLAAAHVLFTEGIIHADRVEFHSLRSGTLPVERRGRELILDFPLDTLEEVTVPREILDAIKRPPLKTLRGRSDYLFIYASQSEIEQLNPDFESLKKLGGRGIIVTSLGNRVHFVSRFFAPGVGINEDPVTGSAHTTLAAYWSRVLDKKKLRAKQLSKRRGEVSCEVTGDRVRISGNAVTYLKGEIEVTVCD